MIQSDQRQVLKTPDQPANYAKICILTETVARIIHFLQTVPNTVAPCTVTCIFTDDLSYISVVNLEAGRPPTCPPKHLLIVAAIRWFKRRRCAHLDGSYRG